jgi:2-polyprenyl-3-methyl-5-hydroxy-6-metoxy-1,4-benzoquinol methylase
VPGVADELSSLEHRQDLGKLTMNSRTTEPPRFRDWEDRYREEEIESMPWFHPDIDPDIDRILRRLDLQGGAVLDLGSGPGTQAIAIARRGFRVTGTDISDTAVMKARIRAEREKIPVEFIRDDILESRLEGPYDLVLDRGCFHVLDPDHRSHYRDIVFGLTRPGGHLILKCFSYREPGDEGPYRFTPQMIEMSLVPPFLLRSLEETAFMGNRQPPPHALLCLLEKRGSGGEYLP